MSAPKRQHVMSFEDLEEYLTTPLRIPRSPTAPRGFSTPFVEGSVTSEEKQVSEELSPFGQTHELLAPFTSPQLFDWGQIPFGDIQQELPGIPESVAPSEQVSTTAPPYAHTVLPIEYSLSDVRRRLYDFLVPQLQSMQKMRDVSSVIQPGAKIGSGIYKNVSVAQISGYDVAVKILREDPRHIRIIPELQRETQVVPWTNRLLLCGVVPSFPYVYYSKLDVRGTEIVKLTVIEELAQTDLKTYMQTPGVSKGAIISALFQVFSAVLSLHALFGISHNDVKLSNILVWSATAPSSSQVFRYIIFGKEYTLATHGLLVWLDDFGLVSGDVLGISHRDIAYRYFPHDQRTRLTAWTRTRPEFLSEDHVLKLNDPGDIRVPMRSYARDFWFPLTEMLKKFSQTQRDLPKAWLLAAQKALGDIPGDDPDYSQKYFERIFSKEFMMQTDPQLLQTVHFQGAPASDTFVISKDTTTLITRQPPEPGHMPF